MLLTREFSENEYLMMVTKNGTVKRLAIQAVNTQQEGRHPGFDSG